MKKVSLRKFSVLGLVLLGASAVTAAIIPGKSAARLEGADNGTLKGAVDGQTNTLLTCVLRDGTNFSCNVTVGTATSGDLANSFVGENNAQTQTNTSRSAIVSNKSSVI